MAASEVNIYDELMKAMDEVEWSDSELEEGELVDLIKFPGEMEGKENKQPLSCRVNQCKGKSFSKMYALKRHWKEVHEKSVQLMECTQCTKIFRRNSDLKRHFVSKHGSISQKMCKVVSRPNKFFVDPQGVEPPRGFLTPRDPQRVVQVTPLQATQAASSQLARVPDKATVAPAMTVDRSAPSTEVIPNQEPDKSADSISEGLLTSRDLLVKKVMEAKEKQRYWAGIETEAKEAIRKFDQEKERARVSQLERQLKEERELRMQAQQKVCHLQQLETQLKEERELRKQAEQKVRHLQEESSIPERMDFLDFCCLAEI